MTTNTVPAADPSITYSPQNAWTFGAAGTMLTTAAGATAEFSFTGGYVVVYGAIPPIGPGSARSVSTYSLDNSTSPYVFNSTDFPSKANIPLFHFYQSPKLVNGNHSLLITSTENQTVFVLDAIVYGSNNSGSGTILSPFSPTGTPVIAPPPIASATYASSAVSLSSPTANSDIGSSTSLPVGGIVGGIIAALILLAGLIAWLLIRRRINRRTEKHRTVTPFIASRNDSRASNRMLLSPVVPQYNDEKISPPPPFVPSPAAVAAQRGSMYKPGGSDVLPPMEFGYGGGV